MTSCALPAAGWMASTRPASPLSLLLRPSPITKLDLFELGLRGGAQSAVRRAKLMKRLELPEHLSANALVTVLASLYSREELYRLCASLFGEGEQ